MFNEFGSDTRLNLPKSCKSNNLKVTYKILDFILHTNKKLIILQNESLLTLLNN